MAGRLARVAGWLLGAASLIFVLIVARERAGEIAEVRLSARQWAGVAGLAAAYGSSLMLLAVAWHCLLRLVNSAPACARVSMHAYAASQLAKYVPGNVFHLVGRHVLLRAHGLSDKRLALASIIEIALMAASAGLFVLATLAVEPPPGLLARLGPLAEHLQLVPLAVLLVLGAALPFVGRVAPGGRRWLVAAFGLHCLFFAAMGAIIVALLAMLAPASPWLVAGGGVAAWLAGFLTPGAPSGLGVREAAMLLFVGDSAPAAALVVAAALFRAVTLLGDLICFVIGQALAVRRPAAGAGAE